MSIDIDEGVTARTRTGLEVVMDDHRFVYVVPVGLGVTARYGCGMWWVHEDGSVQIAARAKVDKTPEALSQQVIQALAYRAARKMRGLTPI